jgi:hypothetical protein
MTHDTILIFAAVTVVPGIVLTGILWFVFEEVTVRKLRKNPKTKDELGFEFVSGGNIVGVAQTLSLPKWFIQRCDRSGLYLLPKSGLLYRNTTALDRVLGRAFYWTLITTVTCAFICMFLSWFIS